MKVEYLGKKFKPGNPMHQDPFPMGQTIGTHKSRIMVLYTQHEPTSIRVVDEKTGEAVRITLTS